MQKTGTVLHDLESLPKIDSNKNNTEINKNPNKCGNKISNVRSADQKGINCKLGPIYLWEPNKLRAIWHRIQNSKGCFDKDRKVFLEIFKWEQARDDPASNTRSTQRNKQRTNDVQTGMLLDQRTICYLHRLGK